MADDQSPTVIKITTDGDYPYETQGEFIPRLRTAVTFDSAGHADVLMTELNSGKDSGQVSLSCNNEFAHASQDVLKKVASAVDNLPQTWESFLSVTSHDYTRVSPSESENPIIKACEFIKNPPKPQMAQPNPHSHDGSSEDILPPAPSTPVNPIPTEKASKSR